MKKVFLKVVKKDSNNAEKSYYSDYTSMAAFYNSFQVWRLIKRKVKSLTLPKNELFTGICIGFCLLFRDIYLENHFWWLFWYSSCFLTDIKTSCRNLPTSQLSSFLFHKTSYSLRTLKKTFPINREIPWETSAKVKFFVLLQAVYLFIIIGIIRTLSNI